MYEKFITDFYFSKDISFNLKLFIIRIVNIFCRKIIISAIFNSIEVYFIQQIKYIAFFCFQVKSA